MYRFGDFTLDTRSGELRRGAYRVRLRPQPAALLDYLVRHAGELVSRDELRQVLWPDGTFVHFDHGLNSCIKQLRAALLDDKKTPRYLETLPRRGYRFIAPIDTGQEPEPDYTVSGTARREGRRLRVKLELRDTATNTVVWSSEFDCDADDARGTQTRMAQEVLSGVRSHHSSLGSSVSHGSEGIPPLSYFAHGSEIG